MTQRPNILFISVDDLNNWPRCLGKYPHAITPNLDRLAARGTLFRNAHTPAPVCLPGRTAVLSGISPSTSGCYANCQQVTDVQAWTRSQPLRESLPLPLFFKRNGYETLSSGKIFHGHEGEEAEVAEVFGERPWTVDNATAVIANGRQKFDVYSPGFRPYKNLIDTSNTLHYGPLPEGETASDEPTTDWVISQLQKEHEQPFLLGCGFFKPHTPLTVPREFFDLYDPEQIDVPEPDETAFHTLPEIAKGIALTCGNHDFIGGKHYHLHRQHRAREIAHAYLACVSYMDDCLGRVLNALDASPHAGNTIVAFWADHGWSLGHHFHWQKWALWEQVSNVPLIIARPGQEPAVCDTPVSTLDLYPTLADLADLEPRPEWEGHSLRPLLKDSAAAWPHPAITSYGPGNHAVRTRQGSYLRYADGSEELYHPATDPREEKNLSRDPAWQEVKAELRQQLPEKDAIPLHRKGEDLEAQLLTLKQGESACMGSIGPAVAGKSIHLRATVHLQGGDGVIVYHNGLHTGYAFYVRDRRPHFALRNVPAPLRWDDFTARTEILRLEQTLPRRPVKLELVMAQDGQVTLRLDDEEFALGQTSGPLHAHPIGYLHVGFIMENSRLSERAPMLSGETGLRKHPFPGSIEDFSIRFGEPAA